jgi:hypothetical protein
MDGSGAVRAGFGARVRSGWAVSVQGRPISDTGGAPVGKRQARASLGETEARMLYSILCYESEALAAGRTRQEDEAMMTRLQSVAQRLKDDGKLGPIARLMPTTTATHIRAGRSPVVMDGPFAETKEQLLGFYVVDCPTLEDAIAAATLLAREKSHGTLEVRPVAVFNPLDPPR